VKLAEDSGLAVFPLLLLVVVGVVDMSLAPGNGVLPISINSDGAGRAAALCGLQCSDHIATVQAAEDMRQFIEASGI